MIVSGPEIPHAAQPEQPVFQTDNVAINHLTTTPDGINVDTRRTVGRNALTSRPTLTHEQARQYRDAMRGESGFQGVAEYAAVRDQYGAHSPEALAAWAEYRGRAAAGKKVGLRNLDFDSATSTLTVDVINVPFPTYKEFGVVSSSPELIDFAEPAASAMVVVTADNRLVIQHRAVEKPRMLGEGKVRGNALYNDVPGASAAGMFDATPSEKPGVPQAIDEGSVIAGIMREAGEELGLGPEHLETPRIVGVARDKVQIHTEFLLLARTDLTTEELNEVSRTSNRNKNLGDADFEEKFLTIEASPAAIHTLLTEVKCPIPPTHAAAMVAAGYFMVLEAQGLEAADHWRNTMEQDMNRNIQGFNKQVADYYRRYPKAQEGIPERFWGKRVPARNLEGYSPAYSPEEQGLPSLEDELVRTGLKPETRELIEEACLLDINGTPSDSHTLDTLTARLRANKSVGLTSDRSTDWILETIVAPLAQRLGDNTEALARLSVIGENGSNWAAFNQQGEVHRGDATTDKPMVAVRFLEILRAQNKNFQSATFEVIGNNSSVAEELALRGLDVELASRS